MRRALHIVALCALLLGGCGQTGGGTRRALAPALEPVAAVILDAGGRARAEVRADGPITAAAPDDRGGWWVSGTFTRVAGLAASDADVYVGHIRGDDGTLWLAVLDARTGAALGSPRAIPDNGPRLAADGGHLFVANPLPITSCVAEYRGRATRVRVRFAVHMLPEVGCVNDMVAAKGALYLAGSLGVSRRLPGAAVARFDIASGQLDRSWHAEPTPCPDCYGLAYAVAVGDGRVYVAGPGRPSVYALSERTGAIDRAWHAAAVPGSGQGGALAVAGRALFVLTPLSGRGGLRSAHGLLLLDADTGGPRWSWHPPSGRRPGPLVASGDRVLVALSRSGAR